MQKIENTYTVFKISGNNVENYYYLNTTFKY